MFQKNMIIQLQNWFRWLAAMTVRLSLRAITAGSMQRVSCSFETFETTTSFLLIFILFLFSSTSQNITHSTLICNTSHLNLLKFNELFYGSCGNPVFAMTGSNEAVLVVGYDANNVIIFDPSSGNNFKQSITEAEEVFKGAGNVFFTYLK